MALSHAIPYEDSVRRLLPWVPDTLSRLNGLGPCPTEPEAVEQRKNEIEVPCIHVWSQVGTFDQ